MKFSKNPIWIAFAVIIVLLVCLFRTKSPIGQVPAEQLNETDARALLHFDSSPTSIPKTWRLTSVTPISIVPGSHVFSLWFQDANGSVYRVDAVVDDKGTRLFTNGSVIRSQ